MTKIAKQFLLLYVIIFRQQTNFSKNASVIIKIEFQKMCKIVLSEIRQIFTNFDNSWHKNGKEAKMCKAECTYFYLI